MKTNSDFYNAADTVLSKILGSQIKLVSSNTIHITYELYVYSLVIEAFFEEYLNSKVQYLNYKNIHNNEFKPNLAPGKLYSGSYFEYEFQNENYEVHLDILYHGQSKERHEIDISIITNGFNDKMLYAAIECKYRSHHLPFNYTREFIGTLSDFYQTTSKSTYNKNRKNFLVTNATNTYHNRTKNFIKKRMNGKNAPKYTSFIEGLNNDPPGEKAFKDLIKKEML